MIHRTTKVLAISLSALALVAMGSAHAIIPPVTPATGPIENGDMTLGVPVVPVGSAGQMTAQTSAYRWSLITNAYTHAPHSTTSLVPVDGANLALQVDISPADQDDWYVALGQKTKGWKASGAGETITLSYRIMVPEGSPTLYAQSMIFTNDFSGWAVGGWYAFPADGQWRTIEDTIHVLDAPGDYGNANWLLDGSTLGWTFLALYPAGPDGGKVLVDDVAVTGAVAPL